MQGQESLNYRQKLFEIASAFSDKVVELPRTKKGRVFEFIQYGGTFEGNTHWKFNWTELTAMNVLRIVGVEYLAEKAVFEILENEMQKKRNRP